MSSSEPSSEEKHLEELLSLKEKGNAFFKAQDFNSAIVEYSKSIKLAVNQHRDILATILSNRAACYLKLEKFAECKDDCSAVLEIDGSHVKAYFRKAQALERLGDLKGASSDLSRLLHIDPKNADAIAMMRRVRTGLEKEKLQDSEVNRILQLLATPSSNKTEDCLRSLIGLCVDDASHALDFLRKGGVIQIAQLIESKLADDINASSSHTIDHQYTILALRILTAACTHDSFVKSATTLGINTDDSPASESSAPPPLLEGGRISWPGICHLLCHRDTGIAQTASSLVLRILKCLPAGVEKPYDPKKEAEREAAIRAERAKRLAKAKAKKEENMNDEDRPRVEILDDNVEETNKKKKKQQELDEEIKNLENDLKDSEQEQQPPEASKTEEKAPKSVPIKEYDLYLRRYPAVLALRGWLAGISNVSPVVDPKYGEQSLEAFTMASDAFAAFFSEIEDYISHEKIIDARMEGVEERKLRIGKVRLGKLRAKTHAEWAIQEGAVDILVDQMDSDHSVVRQRAGACFGRMVTAFDNDEALKELLVKHLIGHDKGDIKPGDSLPPINLCRKRAALEATLFLSRPDLGKWALGEAGGVQQLMLLISTQDPRCQEVTSEVLCLASASEGGGSLLGPIVSSGVLQTLMMSSNPSTRAAAAAAMTKLSIQAKALKQDSPETSQMLNVVLDVLKHSAKEFKESQNSISTKTSSSDDKKIKGKGVENKELVSFSAVGDNFFAKKGIKDETKSKTGEGGRALTSTERAVEVLAAMVGQSYVKDELVHGSYRVAASVEHLLGLDLDTRSTVAYGVAHILAAVTVTNKELHAKALAEKDMTVEQYEQLAELQRVKAKDDDGNEVEEKRPDMDTDTEQLCRLRIKRVVTLNAIPALVRLLSQDSKQTKEYAARALRQICVEESIRGQMGQQGGLKACTVVATDEDCDKGIRREAAHAIAKTLVTTNPTILSEHLRLGCIKPLVFLCRDVDATNLQQFEALLALTNLSSCGPGEQERFAAEKGISAAHYLMFSDHLMVRRAATEVLCNLSSHEKLLKIMRIPDKVRLWLGLCEDWDNEENENAFATACAASGTLASAVRDPDVAKALLEEKCATSLISLLESQNLDLVHRCLVIVLELIDCEEYSTQLATHLLESGIVPCLSHVIKSCNNDSITELAKNAALALSKVVGKIEK